MGDKSDDTKRLILARRAKFVAAALASVAAVGAADACGGTVEPVPDGTSTSSSGGASSSGVPQPCLTPPNSSSSASSSGIPQPCLTQPLPVDAGPPVPDAGNPQPCLKIAFDGGEPQPCLSVPAPDASDDK